MLRQKNTVCILIVFLKAVYRFAMGKVIVYRYHFGSCTCRNISRFSRNSEAHASEFLENLEEMFPAYRMKKEQMIIIIHFILKKNLKITCLHHFLYLTSLSFHSVSGNLSNIKS